MRQATLDYITSHADRGNIDATHILYNRYIKEGNIKEAYKWVSIGIEKAVWGSQFRGQR